MYSITPDIRRDYHPKQRLTATPPNKPKDSSDTLIRKGKSDF
jgi:hypothetical protein